MKNAINLKTYKYKTSNAENVQNMQKKQKRKILNFHKIIKKTHKTC